MGCRGSYSCGFVKWQNNSRNLSWTKLGPLFGLERYSWEIGITLSLINDCLRILIIERLNIYEKNSIYSGTIFTLRSEKTESEEGIVQTTNWFFLSDMNYYRTNKSQLRKYEMPSSATENRTKSSSHLPSKCAPKSKIFRRDKYFFRARLQHTKAKRFLSKFYQKVTLNSSLLYHTRFVNN